MRFFFFFQSSSNHPSVHIYIYLLVNHPFHPHIFQGTAGSLWWGAGDGDLGAARSVDLQCPGFQNKRWNHGAKMGVYSIIYNRDIWTYMNNYEHIIIYIMMIMIYIYYRDFTKKNGGIMEISLDIMGFLKWDIIDSSHRFWPFGVIKHVGPLGSAPSRFERRCSPTSLGCERWTGTIFWVGSGFNN